MPTCPYPRCGQTFATDQEVDDHLCAVPAGDPDHQRDAAGSEHERVFRAAVAAARALNLDSRVGVEQLQALYDQSRRNQAAGTGWCEPTYRRGLRAVLAARLSERATALAGRRVVVTPAMAYQVLDGRNGGAVFVEDANRLDVPAAIERAIRAARRRDDEDE